MNPARRFVIVALALGCICITLTPVHAQTVDVRRIAMSPGMLGTYTGFPVSTGLSTVPIGMKVYLRADTTAVAGAVSWTLTTAPAGSAAVFEDASALSTTIIPDLTGFYVVTADVGGVTDSDTLYAGTWMGMPSAGMNCGSCHVPMKSKWENTKHATIFKRGLTGLLEVEEHNGQMVGVYATGCPKCHTTGWEPNVDNGNYGYVAKATGFDTTWYKGLESAGSDYLIPSGSTTIWDNLQNTLPDLAKMGSISCENCHGPGSGHMANAGAKTMISKSYDAGVCLQCHDAPRKHRLGSYWLASSHATMPLSGEEADRSGCWPCHNGSALPAYLKNPTAPDYAEVDPHFESIACASCHDPHSEENPNQLRAVTFPGLNNGYVPAAGIGGKGQLCMNCHRSRTNTQTVVASQMNRFGNRFYPHYSPQADMYLGANGYEYGLPITGLATHAGLEDGCVTCHMSTRVNGSSVHSNHEMSMEDENGERVEVCKSCHGEFITSFDDIKAMSDYDGNGVVEAVRTEIANMLDQLKAMLPLNAEGEPVNMQADSMLVTDRATQLPAIYNYYFVKNDWSHGIHNTKYAIALLQASMSRITGVEPVDQAVPGSFALAQNYPNPFNPSTTITFAMPRAADVQLHVYNSSGRLVRTLASGRLTAGNYVAKWNGDDESGTQVSSGVYIYRLAITHSGEIVYQSTRKMVLVK